MTPPRPTGQPIASRRSLVIFASLVVVALALTVAPLEAAGVEIKLASVVPENSPWHKLLLDMNTEWQQLSGGTVSLVIYAGGVAGDESDIIRKMRIGQLQGGALTVAGLSDIEDYFSVFQIPLFFESWDELNYVLADLTPLLAQRLEEKGFVWLTWGHVGWIHFFTKKPVERLDDMRELKIFTWAGNEAMVQWYKRNGFNPIALALPDALQGLRTGLIDSMISPPIAALTARWFNEAPYMIDIPLVPLVGAVVVSKRAWDRIPEKDRQPLLDSAGKIGDQLQARIPGMEEFSVTTMKNQGLKVLAIKNSPHSAEWLGEAQKFADEMRGTSVPAEVFDRALRKRDEFRKQRQSQPPATGTTP